MLKTCLIAVAAVLAIQVAQAQTAQYLRGDTVRLAAQENGDPYPDSRIIAVAGDRVHIDRDSVTVNGKVVEDVSPKLLQTVIEPWERVIPDGHYFVVGERGANDSVVAYYGMIPGAKIVRKL